MAGSAAVSVGLVCLRPGPTKRTSQGICWGCSSFRSVRRGARRRARLTRKRINAATPAAINQKVGVPPTPSALSRTSLSSFPKIERLNESNAATMPGSRHHILLQTLICGLRLPCVPPSNTRTPRSSLRRRPFCPVLPATILPRFFSPRHQGQREICFLSQV